jgi:hypothetical protein
MPEQLWSRNPDMKEHETRGKIIREWMVLSKDERQAEEYTQRIANAFFFSVTIFPVAFAFFVLSARAQEISTIIQGTTSLW